MEKEEHFVGKVAQKAIIEKDGKALITRAPSDDSIWELPGGRLNVGETPIEGVTREVFEELGVDIAVHEIIYAELFTHAQKNDPHLFLGYRATLSNPNEKFRFQLSEVAETRWISAAELDLQEIYSDCRSALVRFFSR